MKFVLSHLTTMDAGFVCLAGLDLDTGNHIRPVLKGARLRSVLVEGLGGKVNMAQEIDLGPITPDPNPPETEDHIFSPGKMKIIRTLPGPEFWEAMKSAAIPRLDEIFGCHLRNQKLSCVIDVGMGQHSLGCLTVENPPRIFINDRGRLRARVRDGVYNVELSITDLRFYKIDQKTPRPEIIDNYNRRILMGADVILGVGLTRPWQKPDDTKPYHWLQLNAVHLSDNPAWQLSY
jgi:hypothetical protein